MKRRSLNIRRFAGGVVAVFGILAFFTTLLLPLEKIMLDRAGAFLLWYMDIKPQYEDGHVPMNNGLRIIGRRADEYQTVLLIARALPEGSKIVSGNVLVGIVKSSGNAVSKVEVIASPFFKIQGVLERSGVVAELEGRGAGLLETKVPRGVAVERGDAIWYDEGRLLLLAKVAKVVDIPSDPFITIFAEHPVNLSTLWAVESLE